MNRLAAFILLAALSLAACSGGNVFVKDGVESTYQLAQAAERAGWKCTATEEHDGKDKTRASLEKYGMAQSPCSDGSVVVYSSDLKRDEVNSNSANKRPGWCRYDGRNFTVTGTQYLVEDFAKKYPGGKGPTC